MKRLRIVFFGSGSFGLPTLQALCDAHDVVMVVSQPDRPSGRGRELTPTPVAAWGARRGLHVIKAEDVNSRESLGMIKAMQADAFVVIAFGQKLSKELLAKTFAINLHASILPAYRGAAPINWAIIDGAGTTGVSVIGLADRMDAGDVFATRSTEIREYELAHELHDRLSLLGPEAVLETLERFARGEAKGTPQDESKATQARKLYRADGRVDVAALSADEVCRRVHGLAPWPGVDVLIRGEPVRLVRVRAHPESSPDAERGTVLADGMVACGEGRLEIAVLMPHGSRPMAWADFRNGRRIAAGTRVEPAPATLGTARG